MKLLYERAWSAAGRPAKNACCGRAEVGSRVLAIVSHGVPATCVFSLLSGFLFVRQANVRLLPSGRFQKVADQVAVHLLLPSCAIYSAKKFET